VWTRVNTRFEHIFLGFENYCVRVNTDTPIPQQPSCRSGTLVSGNIKLMRVFAGVPKKGDFKRRFRFISPNFILPKFNSPNFNSPNFKSPNCKSPYPESPNPIPDPNLTLTLSLTLTQTIELEFGEMEFGGLEFGELKFGELEKHRHSAK